MAEIINSERKTIKIEQLGKLKQVNNGYEKTVYRCVIDAIPAAVKIFKTHLEGKRVSAETINRKAREEFEAHRRLRASALSEFIPEAYMLVEDENRDIIGLIVEWKDGQSLSDLYQTRPVNAEKVDKLEKALMSFAKSSQVPEEDIFQETNIMYDQEKDLIWLAECRLVNPNSKNFPRTYVRAVKEDMLHLRKTYVKNK